MDKICIVTGGSGGHIFPALTYADYAKKDYEVIFIGNDHKMESQIIPEAGYQFYSIHNEGLQGTKLDMIKALLSQIPAIRKSKSILKKIKPKVVIAFGGYVSLPVVIAADSLNIPIVLHEQNALPGKANKILAKKAQHIITCYEEAFTEYDNTHLIGNPRASLAKLGETNQNILTEMKLDANKPIVLFIMGSQGSSAMNEKYLPLIESFEDTDIQLVFSIGQKLYDEFKLKLPKDIPSNIHIYPFVDAKSLMPHLDLLVARSGATTIAEVQAFGVPTLFIPSPYVANNHQYYNALSLYKKEACAMIEEKEINADTLKQTIRTLINDTELLKLMSENVKRMSMEDATFKMHDLIMEVVNTNEKT